MLCRGPGLRRARSSGMEMKRGRQLRRPLSYAWRNARNISPSFGGSPCGGTGPFAHQGTISRHRKEPLKWEKDQPSRDNDPPLFVVFDVDAFFLEAGFQVRPRHDLIPIAPFATTANHLFAPRLYRATIINQLGGADQEEPRIFFDNGTGSTGTGSSAPDFSNPTYCAQLPPVSRKAGAW
jgi:hypothetical protein